MARVSHDQNFKNLILDYSRHALAFFAPEEAPGPEDDVRILPGPVGAGLVPARTRTCGNLQGGRGRAPPLRTRRESQLAWPVSIFLRAGAAPATVALGTERGRYLTFDFLACRLYAMDAREWRDSDNPVALTNLPNMRRPADLDRVDVFAPAVRGLRAVEPDGGKLVKYARFIDIYSVLTEKEQESYRRRYPEESKTMAGMIQRAHDEGMHQGRAEGIREGAPTCATGRPLSPRPNAASLDCRAQANSQRCRCRPAAQRSDPRGRSCRTVRRPTPPHALPPR